MAKPILLRYVADTEPAARASASLAAAVASAMAGISSSAVLMHQTTGNAFDGLGAKLMTAVRVMSTLKAAMLTAEVALATFTVAAAAGTVELARFVGIAEKAAASNVGTTFFQAFTEGADAFRMKVKDLQADFAGLEKSTRERFDLNAAGQSTNAARSAVEGAFLGEFGPGSQAVGLIQNAQTAEERIRAVLVALRDLEAQGRHLEAIDIGRRLGMTNFVEQVERGKASFAGLLAETDRLAANGLRDGSLVSPELISRADDLRLRFSDAANELSRNVRPILDECARLALSIGNGAAWTAEQFAALVGVVGRVVAALRNATVEASALNGAASRLQTIQAGAAPSDLNDGAAQAQYARDRAGMRAQRGTTGQSTRAIDDAIQGMVGVPDYPAAPVNIAGPGAPVPNVRPPGAPTGGSAPSARQAAAETDEWAKAYEKLINNLEKANATLQAEFATVGKSNVERTKAVELAKAEAEARRTGGTLTDEQRAKVLALAEAQARLKNAIADATAAQTAFSDAMKYAGDRIVDMVFNGRSLQDVLKGLGAELLRASLTGQGMFAQLLGFAPSAGAPAGSMGGLMGLVQSGFSASGGMWTDSSWMADLVGLPSFTFATGGFTGAGDPSQLAGSVHRGEFVFDAAATSRIGVDTLENMRQARIAPDLSEAARVASGAPAFSSTWNIDARGADQAAVARLEAALARHDAEFEARTISTVRDAQKTMNLK